MKKKEQRFILLPAKGLVSRPSENPTVDPNVTNFLVELSGHTGTIKPFSMRTTRLPKPMPIKVIDSVHEDGAKLVNLEPDQFANFHLAYPGVRIVPVVYFDKMVVPRYRIETFAKLSTSVSSKIKFTDETGKPVTGAEVVAFTNFERREGASGKTNSRGVVSLRLSPNRKIERLYVYPQNTWWPILKKRFTIKSAEQDIKMMRIDSQYPDVLDFFYKKHASAPVGSNATIKVAVIDTGVGPHKYIHVAGGECTVENEKHTDYVDYDGHGTHVAGIISSFARRQNGSPAIEIYSFRVFPKSGEDGASNYSIVKAIDRAVQSGCILINMSLGGGDPDDATKDAISEAHSKGVICFVATGNDDRAKVCFPASYSLSVAVGAMGRKGTFPRGSEPADCAKSPYGKDKKNFVASFSNIGPEVDLIAPGVGIVSCAPGDRWAVMNGTSMACPAATGAVARLLLDEGTIVNLPPDAARANAILKFMAAHVTSLGFKPQFEGRGMIS